MAYTFFPESVSQIDTTLKFPKTNKEEVKRLWSVLNKKYKLKAPINIDPGQYKIINVVRALQGTADLGQVKREAKLNILSIKFGNGSLGGRGVQNKGNLFENQYAQAIVKYDEGDKVEPSLEKSIADLYKTYKLSKYKKLVVKEEGAANTKRPIVFGSDIIVKADKQVGLNIGPIVTDLTLMDSGKPKVYLSLKLGGTTTFFNAGVKTVLTTDEIKANKIKNPQGNRLLKMFGIDKNLFADVFNGKLRKGVIKNVWPTMDGNSKRALEKHKQGFETPFTGTRADIATAKRIVQKYEAQYGKTFKELVEYQQKVLVYLKDSFATVLNSFSIEFSNLGYFFKILMSLLISVPPPLWVSLNLILSFCN